MTHGDDRAVNVPSSGTVTWRSARTSSITASIASSVRSISSTSRTVGEGDVMAAISGRATRKSSV